MKRVFLNVMFHEFDYLKIESPVRFRDILEVFKCRPRREFLNCNSIFDKVTNFEWYKMIIL